ncbi:YigZ family protein [Desertivirga brevis]|uniref:YigZ family protein n=1 Tax=Desertivirga brevis TaxID=2810310 RepID=UPI001A9747EB|nr:YigZ family protein [Pedobacter sp. SYSU D00873]
MLFDDRYKTVKTTSEGIFRDKGSKFIAYCYPVKTEGESKVILAHLKAEHPKARHHCWALRLSPDRSIFRINDDGEPSGTAGRPILNVLLSNDLTNVFVVVVRYFGGTLLGVPGLINAYKTATVEALQNAEIIEKTVNDIYRLNFEYLQMNEVMRVLKDINIVILKQDYDNNCILEIEIPKSKLNDALLKLDKIDLLNYTYLQTV